MTHPILLVAARTFTRRPSSNHRIPQPILRRATSISIAASSLYPSSASPTLTKRRHNYFSSNRTINTDTLIIGGGPIGLSTAFHLASQRQCRSSRSQSPSITIIERDPTYALASATLSAGGIRQQFSVKENVQMSLYGRDFLRTIDDLLRVVPNNNDQDYEDEVDVHFQEHGYLFLASTPQGKEQLIQNHKTQQSAGCHHHLLLSPSQLQHRFPWLNTEDILLGSFGEKGEGWFDPWAYIRGLTRKVKSMGVEIVKGTPISAVRNNNDGDDGRVLSVDVALLLGNNDNANKNNGHNVRRYHVNHVVNAAGAHCRDLMDTLAGEERALQHAIPVEPRKRCIFFIHCATTSRQDPTAIVPRVAPLTVCPVSNVYFRSEGRGVVAGNDDDDDDCRQQQQQQQPATGNFLCGVSPPKEFDEAIQDMGQLEYADHELWEEIIWPALYHRVPAFGEVKVKSSWAGLYECE